MIILSCVHFSGEDEQSTRIDVDTLETDETGDRHSFLLRGSCSSQLDTMDLVSSCDEILGRQLNENEGIEDDDEVEEEKEEEDEEDDAGSDSEAG